MICPSSSAIQSDSLNMKRVQRLSMQYEQKNIAPLSPVAPKKLPPPPPPTPRQMKKSVLPPEVDTLMNELNSKLKARKELADSILSSEESFYEAEFSNLPEIQPDVLVRSLLEQIKMFSEFSMLKEDERMHFQSLLNRLGNAVRAFEESYKKRFMEMKSAQESSFAEIFIEKNDELTKLRSEIENLNKLKKVGSPRLKDELSAAHEEVQRLNGIVQQQNDEINKLTHKVLDAQSYIESLEKTKKISQPIELAELHPNVQMASEHFKTIKQALLANRNLLKAIQLKKQMK